MNDLSFFLLFFFDRSGDDDFLRRDDFLSPEVDLLSSTDPFPVPFLAPLLLDSAL